MKFIYHGLVGSLLLLLCLSCSKDSVPYAPWAKFAEGECKVNARGQVNNKYLVFFLSPLVYLSGKSLACPFVLPITC